MKSPTDKSWFLTIATMVLGVLAMASPALAQWTRVTDVPMTPVYQVQAAGDTILAAADTSVYITVDGGASWRRSAKPAVGVVVVDAVWIRNGLLYAGTFGQGVFISSDLGASWAAFNEGLVGGILDSQLDVVDFQVLGDDLVAATAGAGVYVRSLAGPGTWQSFGDVFEPNQASNVNSVALGGTRLLASAGANGMVFVRDPGDPDWTISDLDNVGIHAGLTAQSAAWNGSGWVVGTNLGIFRSVGGEEPWTRFNPGLGALDWTTFATQGQRFFVAIDIPFGALIESSDDGGATWQNEEDFPNVFVQDLATGGNILYAARGDGLWQRPLGTVSVARGSVPDGLRFALAGPQPFRDQARLWFELPRAGTAAIDVLDVLGRRVGERIEGYWSAGQHEVSLNARRLSPGVYIASLTAGGAHGSVRLVHVR